MTTEAFGRGSLAGSETSETGRRVYRHGIAARVTVNLASQKTNFQADEQVSLGDRHALLVSIRWLSSRNRRGFDRLRDSRIRLRMRLIGPDVCSNISVFPRMRFLKHRRRNFPIR